MAVIPIRPAHDLSNPSSLVLDLVNPKPKEVVALHEAFVSAMRAHPDLGPLPVTTGWNEISPAISVNLLQRNPQGANRWLDPATVFYYATQMKRGEWKPTGQPILIDVAGTLKDAQHRLMASVISGVTFTSYVVADVPLIDSIFLYIDNSKARGIPAALQTAGFNGVSPIIAKVLRFAEEVRHGVYNPSGGKTKLARMSPAQVIKAVEDYPNIQPAAKSAVSDWADVVDYVGRNRKDTIAYIGMRILDEHDESVADEFFEALMVENIDSLANDHPIGAVRREIDKDKRQPKQMVRQHLAAMLIICFNAWYNDTNLQRRWMLAVNEDFPAIVPADAHETEAAE